MTGPADDQRSDHASAVARADGVAGDLAFFKFGADTYAYYDNTATTAIGVNDALIKLTGVDLTTLSFTGANAVAMSDVRFV